jgi:chemotaxis signal transduction protein
MTDSMQRLTDRAAELRSAFDCAFSARRHVDDGVKHDLLAIRVGTEACAVRLSEITGLHADRKITSVPGSNAALLGIAGFRGALVPVYSLRTLLGQPESQAALRWLVIAAAAPIALAFEAFEGHLRVAADAILPEQSRSQSQNFSREFIRAQDVVRAVMHLPSILDALNGTDRPQIAPVEE